MRSTNTESDGRLVAYARHLEGIISEYWVIALVASSTISLAFTNEYFTKPPENEEIAYLLLRYFLMAVTVGAAFAGILG